MSYLLPVGVCAPFAIYTFSAIGISTPMGQTASEFIVHFFQNLFYHPSENSIAIIVIIVAAAALVVGTAFLVKLLYDRYRKTHPL